MKNRKRLLCGALVLTMAATTVFATGPMTKAETIEIVQDASVNYADALTIHAKGSGLTFYAWKGSSDVTAEWPGDKMTDEGNGWCSYSLDKEFDGFLVVDSNNNKITPNGANVTDKKSGEWWLANGAFSDKNPDGETKPTPTPTPTGKDDPTPIPTKPADKDGKVTINSVSPKSGTELEAGKECTIEVDAKTDINDKVLYYKFDVTCDGKKVDAPHYTKESTFTFTPESGKKYKAVISVQAHDEENTTETVTCTYTTSGEVIEGTKEPGTPTTSPDVGDSEESDNPTKPDKTQKPDETDVPTKTSTPKPT